MSEPLPPPGPPVAPPVRPAPPPAVAPPPPVPEGYVPVGWNGVPRPPRVDGLAIASVLCGAAGLLCFLTPVLGFVFGLVARSRIRSSNGDLTGAGLALAGTVVSAAMFVLLALLFVVGRFLA